MRLPRMTMRRLMVYVLVAGTAIGVGLRGMVNLRRYEWIANLHENRATGLKESLGLVTSPSVRARMEAKIRWHEAMVRKYRDSAFVVWPDPPEPK